MLRFCLLVIVALGCTQEPEELVLAQVGGEPITASEFREFDARIPAGMKEGGQRQVLESLIDKKLLLREADAANMAEDSWFKGELARFKRARLMALYMEREVVAKIELTPEEIERYYRESGRHRALRLGGIMVESLEEAGAITDQLAAGADFHELASAHSVHERTAARGGDTGIYQTRDQMSAETVEQVLGLAIGGVSAPVREVFSHEDFYVIYKVLDEIPAPLSASEQIIVEELTVQKREERRQALRDSLVQAYAPVPRPAAIQRLVENGVMADQAEVLCAYRGGELTVSGFLAAYELLTGRSLQAADSAHVAEVLHRRVLPDLFVSAEIEAAGLAEDERFKETVAVKSEELLLSALRRREVDQHVSVTEEEARDFYDAHPEKFARPESYDHRRDFGGVGFAGPALGGRVARGGRCRSVGPAPYPTRGQLAPRRPDAAQCLYPRVVSRAVCCRAGSRRRRGGRAVEDRAGLFGFQGAGAHARADPVQRRIAAPRPGLRADRQVEKGLRAVRAQFAE